MNQQDKLDFLVGTTYDFIRSRDEYVILQLVQHLAHEGNVVLLVINDGDGCTYRETVRLRRTRHMDLAVVEKVLDDLLGDRYR